MNTFYKVTYIRSASICLENCDNIFSLSILDQVRFTPSIDKRTDFTFICNMAWIACCSEIQIVVVLIFHLLHGFAHDIKDNCIVVVSSAVIPS